jgi:hypothetical protein
MSNSSQAGIINPNSNPNLNRTKKISLTKNLPELTRYPNFNNSNIYTNNSIQYYQIKNPIENVFITQLHLDSNKPKILQQSSLDFRKGLNNNKKNLKNSHPLFGNFFKSLLIQEQQYNQAGVFIGTAKIWLVYNSNIGSFDYVIEINPSQHFTSNINKITKTIIPFIIQSLDISLIINALKKFGVKNIDENEAKKKLKNFTWSFHIQSIPRYVSAFKSFQNSKKPYYRTNNGNNEVQLLTSKKEGIIGLNSTKFKPISNKNL